MVPPERRHQCDRQDHPERADYGLPNGSASPPHDIARDSSGNLWFTAGGATGALGKLDPFTGVFQEYSLKPPATNPVGITAGPEGDIWFTVEGGSEALIGRIAPASGEISQFKVPSEHSRPAHITVGPEEDLWFTESSNPGAIGRFNPKTKEFSQFSTGLTANSAPSGITTGAEGNVWFTEASTPGRIGRIDPTSGTITEFSAGLTAGTPQEITKGSDGNLYFTESGGNGALARIAPTGLITEYTEGLSLNPEPWGVTSGPEGNIWFTARADPATVGVLDLVSPVTPPPVSPTVPKAPQQPAPAVNPVIGRSASRTGLRHDLREESLLGEIRAPQRRGHDSDRLGHQRGPRRDATSHRSALRQSAVRARLGGHIPGRPEPDRQWHDPPHPSRGASVMCATPTRPGELHSDARSQSRKLWGKRITHGASHVEWRLQANDGAQDRVETIDSRRDAPPRVVRGCRFRVRDPERHVTVLVPRCRPSYLARS